MTLFPFISVGFVIMSIFSIVSVFISAVYMNQWTIHKISFAVNACVCPLLACSTALGLMFWLGLRFGSILCVTPFLVLAIGVDDAFLIINSWQRASAESRSHSRKDRIQDRIAAVLVDVGPSITITSLTNMLGFGIGFIWATPEIQLFCIANSVAIFFDFLYTITLYAAIMSLGGRYEIAMEHSNVDAHVESENRKTKASRFLQAYCEWLSNGFTALLMLILLLIYWWISLRGARSAKANLTAAKLFLKDSPMLEMNDIRNKYVLPAYTYITIFVTNPGNLSNPKRVDRIKSLVAEFENIPECNGPEFTRFWIRDYEKYLESSDLLEQDGETNVYSIENLKEFFSWPEYKHWGGFVKLNNKTGNITFYVTVAYHGEKQADWNEKVNMLHHWRSIADNYSDIGAAVFDDDAVFTDQIETLIPVTIQTSVITLACMTVVCIIFIAHTFTVLIAVSTIISIFLGVFGFLAMWDVNVDPISMATMIISIGLSVDFPAHITYHYYRTGLDSNVGSITERMSHTIVTIGYPLLQCSVSTIVFISCLLFVPSYMSKVFVKTIFLVVVLGLIHAIVVVPAILCALSGIHQFLQGRKDSRSTSSNQTDASKFSHITAISVLRPEDDKENGLTFSAPNR
ncbi:hypothetical protein AB6A40_008320 [Gnathostoma spinigerum]|uniref:SSD domain-containing protein n=1 Tax=Gnathostoma spinigerum TaxID=75299 RepID=A0ABD6EVV2_9BILA